VCSSDINEQVKELTGGDFSAKDFPHMERYRTRGGRGHSARGRGGSRGGGGLCLPGQYPAVCRSSYIDPRPFDRFNVGVTIADTLERLADSELRDPVGRAKIERAALDLLSAEEPPPD
jgi:hypothetical protein